MFVFPVKRYFSCIAVIGGFLLSGSFAVGQSKPIEIAKELVKAESNARAYELAQDAARQAGFSIWTEDRAPIAPAIGTPLKLAVTDAELRAFSTMYRSGHHVRLGDLINGLDVFYQGGTASCAETLLYRLNLVSHATKPEIKQFGAMLEALKQFGSEPDVAGYGPDTRLDPLQALFIVRAATEEMLLPPKANSSEGESLITNRLTPIYGMSPMRLADAPGWAEDGFVGGITGLIGTKLESLGGAWDKLGKGVGYANAASSLVKMISTYVMLKGEGTIEAPGNPLVRTLDTSAGGRRIVKMKFYFDGTRVQDWLKDNRKTIALLGLDVDSPKSGPLANMETGWEIGQSRKYATKQLVQLAQGSGDISKLKTDANGEVSIKLDGKPQPRTLDKNKVMAVMKKVPITVTPQVKGTEMGQDFTDAIFGAIGIRQGGLGLMSPIMECLYRMKWTGTERVVLLVKDWEEGVNSGEVSLLVDGFGQKTDPGGQAWQYGINRLFTVTGVFNNSGGVEMPAIDPNMLKNLPPEIRKQMEEAMAVANKAPLIFQSNSGDLSWEVRDWVSFAGLVGECVEDFMQQTSTTVGNKYVKFKDSPVAIVTCDVAGRKAKIQPAEMLEVLNTVETRLRSRKTPKIERSQELMRLFDGLVLAKPHGDSAIEVPLAIKVEEKETIYSGQGTIPVKFGPQGEFEAKIVFNFKLRRTTKSK